MRAEQVVVRWGIWLITIGLMVGFSFRPLPVLAAQSTRVDASSQSSPSPTQPDQTGSSAIDTNGSLGATSGATGSTSGESASIGGCFLGICDPGTWLQNIVTTIVANFLRQLIEDINSAASSFFGSLNFVTRTPPELSYEQQKVQQFETAVRTLANGLLAVVAMVMGFNLLWRPAVAQSVGSAGQVLPRLILGAVLINTSQQWTRLAIDVNNAACDVFVAGPVPSSAFEVTWQDMAPAMLLALLIRAVLLVLLVVQQLMRLALVDVLLVLAPLAALLWILPQTQGWASLWAQRFIGTVFAQFVQMLGLSLGFSLATSLPTGGAAALLQALLGIAVLAIGLKIPGLMGGHAGATFVANATGTIAGAAVGRVAGFAATRTAAGERGGAVSRNTEQPTASTQSSLSRPALPAAEPSGA
jgi:hypothetical protein